MKDTLQVLLFMLILTATTLNHAQADSYNEMACTGNVKVYLDLNESHKPLKEERERVIGIPVVEFVNLETNKSYQLEYTSDSKDVYNNYHSLDSLLCGKYKLYVHYIYSPKVEYTVEVTGSIKNEFRLFQNNTSADSAFTFRGVCHYFFSPDYNHLGIRLKFGDDTLKIFAILKRYNAVYNKTVGDIKVYELKNVVRNYYYSSLLRDLREYGVYAGPIFKYSDWQEEVLLFSNVISLNIEEENIAEVEKYISEHKFKANVSKDRYGYIYYRYTIELPLSYGYGVNSILNEIVHQPWGSHCLLWLIENDIRGD